MHNNLPAARIMRELMDGDNNAHFSNFSVKVGLIAEDSPWQFCGEPIQKEKW